jgi:hypothetical protein
MAASPVLPDRPAEPPKWILLCSTLLSGFTPRTMVLADRGYDAGWIRAVVNGQGTLANRRQPICFSSTARAIARAVLQKNQALPADRQSLRQTRSQLPGVRPTGINPRLAHNLAQQSILLLGASGL